MAQDINSCTFTGNLTRDPREFEYGGDKKLARFTIAVNGINDKTAYVDLTAFNGLAEKVVLPHLSRGSFVVVRARVETRVEDDRGENRTRVGFVVEDLRLGPSGDSNGGSRSSGSSSSSSAKQQDEDPPPF
jgi:single-stranded DNA-binding protein